MLKENLREIIESAKRYTFEQDKIPFGRTYLLESELLRMIENLYQETDLPISELPVIPFYVAEWIKLFKKEDMSLHLLLDESYTGMLVRKYNVNYSFSRWLESEQNKRTLKKAWDESFIVDEDKLYTVVIPNGDFLVLLLDGEKFRSVRKEKHLKQEAQAMTEKEIKEKFKWSWEFARPLEDQKLVPETAELWDKARNYRKKV